MKTMKQSATAIFVGVIVLQRSGVFAQNKTWTPEETCLTGTLPNFFNLGECTKGYSDLCKSESENDGGVGLVLQILKCFATGMLDFDFATQLHLLSEFLKEVFQEADPLTSIVEALCENSPSLIQLIPPCDAFDLDEKALCQDKFELKIPITLNVSQCLGGVPITCIEGKVITEPLVKGLTQFIACMVQTTVKLGAEGTTTEILCYLTKIPELLFGTSAKNYGMTFALVKAVQNTFGVDCRNA